MNFLDRNLIYRVKWICYEDVILPKKVVLLNRNCNIRSFTADDTFYLNKKDFNNDQPVSDILYQIFDYRVSELYFERTTLENPNPHSLIFNAFCLQR